MHAVIMNTNYLLIFALSPFLYFTFYVLGSTYNFFFSNTLFVCARFYLLSLFIKHHSVIMCKCQAQYCAHHYIENMPWTMLLDLLFL